MGSIEISGPSLAGLYIGSNILLGAAAGMLAGMRALSARLARPLTYRHLLAVGRVEAVAALMLPVLTLCTGGSHFSPVKAQVWSASSMQAATARFSDAARIEIGWASQSASLPVHLADAAVLLFFVAGFLITTVPLVFEAREIFRTIRSSHLVRRLGRVRVLVSDRDPVPFAVWVPGRALIVLPAALLIRCADLRLALKHEGQHHRQGDTRYLYASLLLRVLFGLNPAVLWLARQLSELQEYACDEELVGRQGYGARAYCACLLRVADAALATRRQLLRSCMACRDTPAFAKRIEAALDRPARHLGGFAALTVSLTIVCLLTALNAVIASPIRDRRLSRAEAMRLVAAVPRPSAIRIEVNQAVVKQLNLLLGTPDGRAFLRSSIARMRLYEPAADFGGCDRSFRFDVTG